MSEKSDGSTASYYTLPTNATQLQDLISYKNMNAQIGEIFRACYRYGEVEHSDKLRDAKKMKFYAEAEIARLEKIQPEVNAMGFGAGDQTVLGKVFWVKDAGFGADYQSY